MLRTISAALLAVSVIAAPAFAANDKTATTPAPVTTTAQTPAKSSALNANAKMSKHHVRHVRHHIKKKMALHRSHAKVGFRHVSHAVKRG